MRDWCGPCGAGQYPGNGKIGETPRYPPGWREPYRPTRKGKLGLPRRLLVEKSKGRQRLPNFLTIQRIQSIMLLPLPCSSDMQQLCTGQRRLQSRELFSSRLMLVYVMFPAFACVHCVHCVLFLLHQLQVGRPIFHNFPKQNTAITISCTAFCYCLQEKAFSSKSCLL